MTRPRKGDGGSATIWVVSAVVVLLTIALAVLVRTTAVLARHRAEAAADLSALAAAGRIGTSGVPCSAAARVAGLNGAHLASCDVQLAPDGRSGTVRVRVTTAVAVPVVGTRAVTATARAGRLDASQPDDVAAPPRRIWGMWHAFGRTAPPWD